MSDLVNLEDPNILRRLLELENRFILPRMYYDAPQNEIDARVREICLEWMMEVCQEERCEAAVYPLSVNFVDRFLSLHRVSRLRVQMLCCACLLLASKLRQRNPLNVTHLCYYTVESCPVPDILYMESVVAYTLQWNLGSVIPYDFVGTILHRLPETYGVRVLAGRHAEAFLEVMTLEAEYATWPPSYVAVGAIGAALQILPGIIRIWPYIHFIGNLLHQLTGIDEQVICTCMAIVKEVVEKWRRRLYQTRGHCMVTDMPANKKDRHDDGDYPPISVMDFAED